MDCKVIIYISEKDFDLYLKRIQSIKLNKIGNYENCLSWVRCESSWTPTGGAHPYIGVINSVTKEKEVRIEFKCKLYNILRVMKILRIAHPYEEPEIDVIPLFTCHERINHLRNGVIKQIFKITAADKRLVEIIASMKEAYFDEDMRELQ